jgi:flagellar hook-length control protein FliK
MLFTGAAVAAPPASKPNTFANATQFSRAADDTPPPSNTPESTTTDNIPTITQNEPVNKPMEDFRHTLRKTAKIEAPQQDRDDTKSEQQDSASAKPSKANPNQSLSTPEIPITLGALVKEVATKMEPKTGRQLAEFIANLKDGESPPVPGKAAKSAEIKLLVTTDKGQLGLKTVLSNISEGTADTQPVQGSNIDTILVPNSMVASTKAPGNGENAKELIPNALVDDGGKTTVTNDKTASGDNSVAAGSPKSSALSGKKLGTDNFVDDESKTNNEETTITDKSAIPGNNKPPTLNTNFPPIQTKFTEPQSQPVGTTPEKSAQMITAKPSDNTAAAPEIASESSVGNDKESSRAGNKLSDNPTVQELNVTAVQVSTGQTKNHGGPTSNDSSNSDLEKILSHNNPQTPVTEQSHNSAEGAKVIALPGQTSPSSVSADIGKQILESIHSSFREGQDQQITIRLNPPELGKVFIKFDEQDSQIIGLLEVSRPQTRIEIQQALPQIIQNLQNSGIHIKRLEVVLSEGEQPEQEALKDQSLQNGWTQQHDSTNSNMGVNNPDTNGIKEWLINNHSYENISELQEALTTDGSINMLI